ncbi:MAG: tRNA pseudouridine(38-40) synthase TruA [Gammaproteobacteria bacterium]|nr:MAG: tRNA pseudouridine(38-40) synthase TruA [Gammaproteobacteria bacterium]
MRIALGVEYDGRGFHGWQAQQKGVRTVQVTLEQALSKVADHPLRVVCAGRTDTGVHALGQVVHFDTDAVRSERNWLLGSNVNLPPDVSVTWVREVSSEFSARFSAVSRRYRYFILNRTARSAVLAGRVTWVHRPLDAEAMHRAGQALVGEHDFSSYRALGCQAKSPVRTLHSLVVERHGDFVVLSVHANAFLHHMVRNIAGVLIAIGKGDRPETWAGEVLALRDRTLGGVTAPPEGLYFEQVEYPPEFGIPTPTLSGFPCEGVF